MTLQEARPHFKHVEVVHGGRLTRVVIQCRSCRGEFDFQVETSKLSRWANGVEKIQKVFPEMPAGDRELFISGTCDTCFDLMFLEEGE